MPSPSGHRFRARMQSSVSSHLHRPGPDPTDAGDEETDRLAYGSAERHVGADEVPDACRDLWKTEMAAAHHPVEPERKRTGTPVRPAAPPCRPPPAPAGRRRPWSGARAIRGTPPRRHPEGHHVSARQPSGAELRAPESLRRSACSITTTPSRSTRARSAKPWLWLTTTSTSAGRRVWPCRFRSPGAGHANGRQCTYTRLRTPGAGRRAP